MSTLGAGRRVLGRAANEAAYAAALLRARGPGVLLTPPHRLLGTAREVAAYGPVVAAISFAAASFGERTAIVDERGRVSFAELDRRSDALANALLADGLGAGDGLGILVRNHRHLYDALLAGAKVGARTLLLNTDFAGPQLADVCRREGITALVHDAEFAAAASAVQPGRRYLAWTDDRAEVHLETLIGSAPAHRPPPPAVKQQIVLLTSGTTGTPKGAPREVALSLALPGGYLSRIPLRSGRTVVLACPAFHAWGLLSSMLALGLGDTVVTARRTDAAFMLDALAEHDPDALITVPVLLARLVEQVDVLGGRPPGRLRAIAVSGSALSPDLARRVSDTFGDVLYNLYGSTEVAYASIATPQDLRAAPGTVGRPPPGIRIAVLDDLGREVPRGQVGRIFVGSSMHFRGYTGGGSKASIAGLMSTGDTGHVDAAGRLFVDGRDDDMIVSGGENVFPAEVEQLLSAYPGVREAAVVGVDDSEHGARLRAYVATVAGTSLDARTLQEHVRSNLARYKVPREVVFVEALPRNAAGKVVKRELPDPDDSTGRSRR